MAPTTITNTKAPTTSLNRLEPCDRIAGPVQNTASLAAGVVGQFPMREVKQPNHRRGRETSGYLRHEIGKELGKLARLYGEGQGNRRVEVGVRTSKKIRCKYPAKHGKSPPGGDHHPARPFRLGAFEHAGRDHAITEQHNHEGSRKFSQQCAAHHASSRVVPAGPGSSMYRLASAVKLAT
jgi:hypothetical protein